MLTSRRLEQNLGRVRAEIGRACERAGRDPASVRLVAVTKSVGVEVIRELLALGLHDLGESQVQQLARRAAELGCDLSPPSARGDSVAPRWHMIGHLQRNKVRTLLPVCRVIHSVDSVRLAEEIATRAAALTPPVAVEALIEVNVAGEQSKSGLATVDAAGAIGVITRLPQIRIRGLMTMAPLSDDPQAARPHFVALRRLSEQFIREARLPATAADLSMGMSQDFAVAIEEGATLVRVGSRLFEVD